MLEQVRRLRENVASDDGTDLAQQFLRELLSGKPLVPGLLDFLLAGLEEYMERSLDYLERNGGNQS